MLWLRLELAHYLDRAEQRFRAFIVEPLLRGRQAWFQEFSAYLAQPRMTWWEFHVRYTLLRMDAESKWFQPKMSEAEARRFYEKHDYMLWRNLVHRRHSAWRRVLVTMGNRHGDLLEYGCGIGPITSWVKPRKHRWRVFVSDLESPHFEYAMWRVRQRLRCGLSPSPEMYHVITVVDVFEHLAEPEKTAQELVDRLWPGGYLHYNIHFNPSANDLDLATEEQLDATARYLESVLDVVWAKDEYRVGRKP